MWTARNFWRAMFFKRIYYFVKNSAKAVTKNGKVKIAASIQ